MAPTKTVKSKPQASKSSKGSTPGSNLPNRVSKKTKAPPPKQQKTKSSIGPVKKKKRIYTDKELGIPKLNMITPVGVNLPKGKKKGKVFVDDTESMMTIFAIVNANKEGQIESKMMKSRQLEEIREARKKEAEKRQSERKGKLEETKNSMRKSRHRKGRSTVEEGSAVEDGSQVTTKAKPNRKQVSFA